MSGDRVFGEVMHYLTPKNDRSTSPLRITPFSELLDMNLGMKVCAACETSSPDRYLRKKTIFNGCVNLTSEWPIEEIGIRVDGFVERVDALFL